MYIQAELQGPVASFFVHSPAWSTGLWSTTFNQSLVHQSAMRSFSFTSLSQWQALGTLT